MEEEAADDVNVAYQQLKDAGNNAAFCKRERPDMPTITGLIHDNLGLDFQTSFKTGVMKFRENAQQESASSGGGSTRSDFASKSFNGLEAEVMKRRLTLERNRSGGSTEGTGIEAEVMKRRQALEGKLSTGGDGSSEGTFSNGKSKSLNGLSRQNPESRLHNDASQEKSSRNLYSGLMRLASVHLRSSRTEAPELPAEPDPWELVESIAEESMNNKKEHAKKYKVANGRWTPPSFMKMLKGIRSKVTSLLVWTSDNKDEMTDVMARDSTYAVVTFTSRQAAIAARKCLADGRGAESFKTIDSLPVPPLADSAAFNLCDFRGFTKPVTIGLNESQKNWRKFL